MRTRKTANAGIFHAVGMSGSLTDSNEISEYLHLRKNSIKKRKTKQSLIINGYMEQHRLIFKPNWDDNIAKKYLCDCENCLAFQFE